jgi:hypothetical protein
MFTVMSEVAVTPLESAIIWVYPGPTAVARPVEEMLATLGFETDQDTEIGEVEGVSDPVWLVPSAVYWVVCPTAVNTTTPAAGVMEIALSELQPTSEIMIGRAAEASNKDARRYRIIGNLLHQRYLGARRRAIPL